MGASDAAALDVAGLSATHTRLAVTRWRRADGALALDSDELAEEVPVALEYNGISHAVMLATPADLEDFALGFSLSEGLVASPRDVYGIEAGGAEADGASEDVAGMPACARDAHGITVRLRIAAEAFAGLKARRRTLAGRTGCGLCGTESLEQALRLPAPVASTACFDAQVLLAGFGHMQARQRLQRRTGSTHAAAWLRADGTLGPLREDVGRHNALDKLIGALARGGEDLATGAVLVTSRASYEMVQKTASAGIGLLAAVSAPTALAVRVAQDAGVTLAGFVREGGHVIYTHAQRLRHSASATLPASSLP